MSVLPIIEVKVGLDFGRGTIPVGRLARHTGQIYFEFQPDFLERGLEISPLHLPLQPGLQTFDRLLFEGLPGIFNDSLPDGWGRLLLDRSVRLKSILPEQLTPLDRLAYVGQTGMGALVYEPTHLKDQTHASINLDALASQIEAVLAGTAEDVLQELLTLNGSSAGARPKALIGIDQARQNMVHGTYPLQEPYEPWLVKFPNTGDGSDAGAIEYVYALMAKGAGLQMTEVHLFPAQHGAGYFATKRFDRAKDCRFHTHTACGLLHSDYRTPSLDYEDLLALTEIMTRDVREIEKMYQQAVFNVLAHNRDDHAKNFSFLMNARGEWKLSPAYDLTFSAGPGGEQSPLVLGEGKAPTILQLRQLGENAKLDQKRITTIIDQTQDALSHWKPLAQQHGVNKRNIALIAKMLQKIRSWSPYDR